ncbi:hypothetical protein [Bradyrhizobium sp. CW1]|uniref:hypothetical protein n=1 Tax=Bradyrhizobium sp. CW1 TaxID=2782686 RepID=UPI0020004022|nr:hypothetical protein [Bradyrhizobium sp. CW1]UPJ31575.1 hypothetical protein IVB54_32685 [Bradyrhizobium sp. CW1]
MAPNDLVLDFLSDQLTDGRHFRMLTVVDDCPRECLALFAICIPVNVAIMFELQPG